MPYWNTESTERKVNFLSSMVGIIKKSATFDATENAALVTTDSKGDKLIKAGLIYPANDATAQGIVFEDVDVTYNTNAGSILVAGRVYIERLGVETLNADAKAALEKSGIHFDSAPETTRSIS